MLAVLVISLGFAAAAVSLLTRNRPIVLRPWSLVFMALWIHSIIRGREVVGEELTILSTIEFTSLLGLLVVIRFGRWLWPKYLVVGASAQSVISALRHSGWQDGGSSAHGNSVLESISLGAKVEVIDGELPQFVNVVPAGRISTTAAFALKQELQFAVRVSRAADSPRLAAFLLLIAAAVLGSLIAAQQVA